MRTTSSCAISPNYDDCPTRSCPTRSVAFGFGVLGEEPDFPSEIGGVLEELVDAREAQIRNLVEFPQPIQYVAADPLTQDDIEPFGADLILNCCGEFSNRFSIDRTVLARGTYAGGDLLVIERDPIT